MILYVATALDLHSVIRYHHSFVESECRSTEWFHTGYCSGFVDFERLTKGYCYILGIGFDCHMYFVKSAMTELQISVNWIVKTFRDGQYVTYVWMLSRHAICGCYLKFSWTTFIGDSPYKVGEYLSKSPDNVFTQIDAHCAWARPEV